MEHREREKAILDFNLHRYVEELRAKQPKERFMCESARTHSDNHFCNETSLAGCVHEEHDSNLIKVV